MLKNMTRGRLAGLWFAAVALLGAAAVAIGPAFTVGTGLLLMAASLVPPAVMFTLWRSDPPATIAEVLHGAESAKI